MNTTTITAQGINGQQTTKELPAQGEIIVMTTGTPRTGLRHTTAKVTGYTTRSITGTGYAVYVVTAVTADGEELADTRFRPATADEAAEYEAATAPVEIVSAEEAAHRAHSRECPTCSISGSTGRNCHEGMKLWEAARRAGHDLTRAPIITVNRWGTRRAHWNARYALAEIGFNGGGIIKAPAGMVQAAKAEIASELEAARQRRAAQRASGQPLRRR